jgi:uncharacterized protein (TIGR03118 family)
MRVVCLKQLGLLVAVAAGAGVGCGEDGATATATVTSELHPMPSAPAFEAKVRQSNLVADQNGFARKTDPDLQNAWGVAFKGRSIWIAANHTGTDRQYSEDGKLGEVISLPLLDGMSPSSPTGQVANPFCDAFDGDTFIVVSEDGDIFGANPGTATGTIRVPNEGLAVYKGDAIATFHGKPRLFATDFQNRKIDAFEADYSPAKLGGDFVDPELATLTEDGTTPGEMYAPFNIQAFGDRLLVTYALQRGPDNEDDDEGPGRGFVDIFDTDGHYIQRLITRGDLNSPWGLAVSVEHRGDVDLLVGNFGDGHINVYDLSVHGGRVRAVSEGPLVDRKKQPIAIEGLWAIAFGSGRGDFETDDLYFTAGPGNGDEIETHGLFGELDFGRRR